MHTPLPWEPGQFPSIHHEKCAREIKRLAAIHADLLAALAEIARPAAQGDTKHANHCHRHRKIARDAIHNVNNPYPIAAKEPAN